MANNRMRPSGMSLLDYLWINYGNCKVLNTPSSIPQDDVILTEKALTNFINSAPGINSLLLRDHPNNPEMYELVGYANDGSVLTSVLIPKVISIKSFTYRVITLEDINQGSPYSLNTPVLSLVLSSGIEFIADLSKLLLVPSTTNTIDHRIINNILLSDLKIDTVNNYLSPVLIKTNTNGIYTEIKLSSTSDVQLFRDGDLIAGRIPLGKTGKYLKFESISYDEYLLLTSPNSSTIYFITNKPYIYLNNVRYGTDSNLSLDEIIDEISKAGFKIEVNNGALDLINRNDEIISSVSIDEFNQSLNWIDI